MAYWREAIGIGCAALLVLVLLANGGPEPRSVHVVYRVDIVGSSDVMWGDERDETHATRGVTGEWSESFTMKPGRSAFVAASTVGGSVRCAIIVNGETVASDDGESATCAYRID